MGPGLLKERKIMATADPRYKLYQKQITSAAEFHKAQITLLEDGEYITVSAQIPQTNLEYGRNFRFWRWFFDTTMRNFGAAGTLYSCKFLSDWKPQMAVPLSWWKKFLKFFGIKVNKKIMPATGNSIETVIGLTVSIYKVIVLQLSRTEFDKLNSLGLAYVEEVKGDTFPYRLRLGGNVLSIKLKK